MKLGRGADMGKYEGYGVMVVVSGDGDEGYMGFRRRGVVKHG